MTNAGQPCESRAHRPPVRTRILSRLSEYDVPKSTRSVPEHQYVRLTQSGERWRRFKAQKGRVDVRYEAPQPE